MYKFYVDKYTEKLYEKLKNELEEYEFIFEKVPDEVEIVSYILTCYRDYRSEKPQIVKILNRQLKKQVKEILSRDEWNSIEYNSIYDYDEKTKKTEFYGMF